MISYDYDANNATRAADMFEAKGLQSISGAITKLDEVQVQSEQTSLPN